MYALKMDQETICHLFRSPVSAKEYVEPTQGKKEALHLAVAVH